MQTQRYTTMVNLRVKGREELVTLYHSKLYWSSTPVSTIRNTAAKWATSRVPGGKVVGTSVTAD